MIRLSGLELNLNNIVMWQEVHPAASRNNSREYGTASWWISPHPTTFNFEVILDDFKP
jgi:hypothetical protein